MTAAPAQAFASTAVGAINIDSVTVQNAGNTPLTFRSFTTGTLSFLPATVNCNTSTPLAESGTCAYAAVFTPQQTGLLTDSLTIIDNSSLGTTQTVPLSGTGTE